MSRPSIPVAPLSTDILIIGAGVLGLCAAVELTRRGREVMVLDPGEANASSVAAGMIAPAMESVLDGVTPERAALFRNAAAVWEETTLAADPGFAAVCRPTPALWVGGDAGRLAELGFEVEADSSFDRNGTTILSVAGDFQIDPVGVTSLLKTLLAKPPATGRATAIAGEARRWRVTTWDGEILARVVVLATGAAEAIDGLPTQVDTLLRLVEPVRGQIGLVRDLNVATVIRGDGVYVAPTSEGAVIGATMEPGRRDLEPDLATGERLKAAAERLLGRKIPGEIEWRVGIRGSTPDGLPMVGATGVEGLFVSLAPRRNGWLLGPMTGRVLADAVEGKDGGAGSPHAAALDPRRFL